jgi:hypothetical protein
MFFFPKIFGIFIKNYDFGKEKKLEISPQLPYFDFLKQITRFLHHI